MPMGPRPPLSRTILKRERPDNVKSCPATLSAVPPRCPLSPHAVPVKTCPHTPGEDLSPIPVVPVKTCPRSPRTDLRAKARIGEDLSPVPGPGPPVPDR